MSVDRLLLESGSVMLLESGSALLLQSSTLVGIVNQSLSLSDQFTSRFFFIRSSSNSLSLSQSITREIKYRQPRWSVKRRIQLIKSPFHNHSTIRKVRRQVFNAAFSSSITQFNQIVDINKVKVEQSNRANYNNSILRSEVYANAINSNVEIAILQESFNFVHNAFRLLSDNLDLTQVVQLYRFYSINQTLLPTQSINSQLITNQSIFDTLTITPSIQNQLSNQDSISDLLNLTQSLDPILFRVRSISQSLSLTEQISTNQFMIRNLSQSLSLNQLFSSISTHNRSQFDSLTIIQSFTQRNGADLTFLPSPISTPRTFPFPNVLKIYPYYSKFATPSYGIIDYSYFNEMDYTNVALIRLTYNLTNEERHYFRDWFSNQWQTTIQNDIWSIRLTTNNSDLFKQFHSGSVILEFEGQPIGTK